MTSAPSASLVRLMLEIQGLKDLPRAGWVRERVESPESVAAHSWGVAWLALALRPARLDLARCLTYALIHDLAEVRVGDITPHDGVSKADKAQREADAIEAMGAHLPPGIADAWHAYEAQADPEARFVRQLDRLDMALTAAHYHVDGRLPSPQEFLRSASTAIDDPSLRNWLVEVARMLPARSAHDTNGER